ncbi:MAG: cation transporter [Myxococcota bacterium]|nr:cation transporter [Myxococcota bacterium]
MFMPLVFVLAMPVSFEVPGLTCPTCVKPVKKTLALMAGINQVDIDWRARRVKLDIDPQKTSEKVIRAKLDEIGFSAASPTAPLKESDTQDYLTVSSAPPKVEQLAVWGKATVVAICTPGCAPCAVLKKDLNLFSRRVEKVAIRVVVVDTPSHPAAAYLPENADIPYVFVFDTASKKRFAGPAGDGKTMYEAVEASLGVKQPG